MKIGSKLTFTLVTALFLSLAVLPLSSATPAFFGPVAAPLASIAGAAEADPASPDDAEGRIAPGFNDTGDERLRVEPETDLGVFDDTGDAYQDYEDIDSEFDGTFDETLADGEIGIIGIADDIGTDSTASTLIPIAVVVVALIAAGIAAFFIATKKPKPTV
ncbi:MAG: hypothetical protein FWE46_04160 [Coriobacteriia bacterium]|nr:hypothetical protein [Coriobacteriia bacterium]MCL2537410.1 hypothetical protein [Coriobacteriia bacterium]